MKSLITLICIAALSIGSAQAETWMSYSNAYDYDYDYLRSDRVSREHRDAGDVDDWIERGNATVTASPLPGFEDGIRLSAWASGNEDDYDFALSSAIYFFDIPQHAEYVEIKLRYRGDAGQADFDDYEEIAGRVWIRNLQKERDHRSYGDLEDSETLYGDTFMLRARRRSETIKIPTADHVKDGTMEVHLVVNDSGMLDVEYLDVATYRRQPEVRVIHRYVRDFDWRPWNYYSYAYFYDGPSFYATDYDYYIAWSYPIYDHHYLSVRRNFHRYLSSYRQHNPRHYVHRPAVHVDVDVNVRLKQRPPVQRSVRHLTKWTEAHQRTREVYVQSAGKTTSRIRTTLPEVRTRVRSTIQTHREKPVLAKREIRDRTERQRIVTQPRSRAAAPSVRQRSESRSSTGNALLDRQTRTTPRQDQPEQRVRVQSRSLRSSINSATQQRQSVTTRVQKSSTQERRAELEQRIKQRKSSSATTPSSTKRVEVKKRQETTRTQTQSKDDDDDDDEEEKKQQTQQRTQRTKQRK